MLTRILTLRVSIENSRLCNAIPDRNILKLKYCNLSQMLTVLFGHDRNLLLQQLCCRYHQFNTSHIPKFYKPKTYLLHFLRNLNSEAST